MSPLERLQADIAGILEADAYFADIPVYVQRPRVQADGSTEDIVMLSSRMDNALLGREPKAGKSGVGVMVLMPVGVVKSPEAPGPEFHPHVSVRVRELPVVNMDATTGTQKTAEDVALAIANLCHRFPIGGFFGALYCDGAAIAPVLDDEKSLAEGIVTYNVEVTSRFTLTPLSRCAPVTISAAALSVTLGTITSGATITYTTDGTFPRPGAAGAETYGAPFSVASGTTVRASATKSGLHQSFITQSTIN